MANEKRLIDANALKSQITRYHMSLTPRYISKLVDAEIGDIIDIIDEAPTVDAVEVVHGMWEYLDPVSPTVCCSACKELAPWDTVAEYHCVRSNYCPNCGADMRGKKDA